MTTFFHWGAYSPAPGQFFKEIRLCKGETKKQLLELGAGNTDASGQVAARRDPIQSL